MARRKNMNTIEDMKKRLQECIELLDSLLNMIKSNKADLKEEYKKTYSIHSWINDEGDNYILQANEFEMVYDYNVAFLTEQKAFLNQVTNLPVFVENKFSNKLKTLIDNCINHLLYSFENFDNETLLYGFIYNINFAEEYASILILSEFSQINSNIVLIGGNGSGKSSLAKTLKGNDEENISVVPAQKTLYFSLYDKEMLTTKPKELEAILLENNIDKSKTEDNYDYFQYQNNQFTKLIVAMREEYMNYLMRCEENGEIANKEKSVFGILRRIYSAVFPDIELEFKSDEKHYMSCKKNGNIYHINALSEGEKAVMYYSISVLMAKRDSFIVIDEPETYLNPSLTNVLWDILIKQRQDCQFIFITHSIDFVLGRSDSKIAWIKSFQYPRTWEFEFVDDNFTLPKTLLTEVLGSQKAIAFCEGDDKSSIDYQVYRSLIGEKYTVIPVGGHLNVIKYCEVLLKSNWIGRECVGIVDGDNFTDEMMKELSKRNIMVLPFNEIEMLLLSDLVMEYTMRAVRPVDSEIKILEFKEKFWEKANENKEKIILTATKNVVDGYIQKERIQKYDSLESIKLSIEHITSYNVDDEYHMFSERINQVLENKDYDKLLNICNLKKEISRGIANAFLDSDYENKATQQIMTNKELQKELFDKYFSARNYEH